MCWRADALKDLSLGFEIGPGVVVRRVEADVSEPAADDGDWTSPEKVESYSLFRFVGPECQLERRWTDVAEARMTPAPVLEALDVLANGFAGLVA